MRVSLISTVLFVVGLFSGFGPQAQALVIDGFDGSQVPPPVIDTGSQEFSSSAASSAIGLSRKLLVKKNSGFPGDAVRAYISNGILSHSQDSLVTGSSSVTWDGSTDATLHPSGLPSIDLTQDGSSELLIEIHSFDYANNLPLTLLLSAYDAADPSGNTWSSVQVTLNYAVPSPNSGIPDDPSKPRVLHIPFTNFTSNPFSQGISGPANLNRLGALVLTIQGGQDQDLRLAKISTNGQCTETVPTAQGKVFDECGICGGDNSSCSDCKGIPNGTAIPGSSCDTGQAGVCKPGTYSEACACVRNVEPSEDLCDGIDNNCSGSVDESFPNLGKDCSMGTAGCVFSGAYRCNAQGQLECSAIDQTAAINACEASRGCDGVPGSGLVVDRCGVCGGNGTSCLDCTGALNGTAKLDRCGVCNGDGQSCLGCSQAEISSILTHMDNGAKRQEGLLNTVYVRILGATSDKKLAAKVENARRTAHKLQIRNWTISWTFPTIVNTCTNSVLCASSSFEPLPAEYSTHSLELRDMMKDALAMLSKVKKVSARERAKLLQLAASQHDTNMQYLAQVPKGQWRCGGN